MVQGTGAGRLMSMAQMLCAWMTMVIKVAKVNFAKGVSGYLQRKSRSCIQCNLYATQTVCNANYTTQHKYIQHILCATQALCELHVT